MTITPFNRPDIIDQEKAVSALWNSFLWMSILIVLFITTIITIAVIQNDLRFLLLGVFAFLFLIPTALAMRKVGQLTTVVNQNTERLRPTAKEQMHEAP